MKTDILFYQIFHDFPNILFELLGQPATDTAYEFQTPEVKESSFRLDGLLAPVVNNDPSVPIYFVEVQFYKLDKFYSRWFTGIHLYFYQYDPPNKDWYAIVIYDRRSSEAPAHERHRELMARRVQRFYLDEMQEAAEQNVGMGIMQLVVESQKKTGDSARQLIAKARQELPDASRQAKVIELIETIVLYKFPNSSREEIEAMLGLSELKKTRVYQEAIEEGRQEGRQEGRESGKLEAKLEMLPRLQQRGLSVEEIAELLGLDVETISLAIQQQS